MSLCEKCKRTDSKAMRALESLTAGGSEFVDEPETCVKRIRASQDSIWAHLVKLTKENKELRALVASCYNCSQSVWL